MVTKEEIEYSIRGKDDFVKIDKLKRHLKTVDSLDTKKYILLMLVNICEARGLYKEAARYIANASEVAITYKEKVDLYLREAELEIKDNQFESADRSLNSALSCTNLKEKPLVVSRYLDLYRAVGKAAEDTGKKRKAVEVYEKLIQLKQPFEKKVEIRDKLIELHEALGHIRDVERLKRIDFREPPKIDFRPY
jgi:tetratricopeptide (TPR) repeat protein